MFIWFIEGHVYAVLRNLIGNSIVAVVSVVTLSNCVKKKAKAMFSNLLILFCKYRNTKKSLRQKATLQSAMFRNSDN